MGETVITGLKEVNLRTWEKKEISIKDVEEMFSEKIAEQFGKLGLEVNVRSMEDPEQFIGRYYRSNGYFAVNLSPRSPSASLVDYAQIEQICDEEGRPKEELASSIREAVKARLVQSETSLNENGVPDWLIYRADLSNCRNTKIERLFFVEAKSENGSLTPAQLEWIAENQELEVRVMYAIQEEV